MRIPSPLKFIIIALLGGAILGCSTPAQQRVWVEALEQELRDKEDYIFELEAENERLCRELDDAAPSESKTSAAKREPDPPRPKTSPRSRPAEVKPDDLAPPSVEGVGPSIESPMGALPSVEPKSAAPAPLDPAPLSPRINTPSATPQGSSGGSLDLWKPERSTTPPSVLPNVEPPAVEPSVPPTPSTPVFPSALPRTPGELPSPPKRPTGTLPAPSGDAEEIPAKVSRLWIDPARSGGYDADGHPGDDGLQLFIQPQAAGDGITPLAGTLSIAVLDPSAHEEQMRLARWDFSAAQVAEAFARGDGEGLAFRLPWTETRPLNSQLKVFVRSELDVGEQLEGSQDLFVALPGRQISRLWNPRSPEAGPLSPTVATSSYQTWETSGEPAGNSGSAAPPTALPEPAPRRAAWRAYR